MKKIFLIVLLAVFSVQAMAERVPNPKKCAISAGLLQGGGGLVGIDFEYLFANRLSVQAGAGLVSFGGAVNYHFKPYINSSMISVVYMHQGIGDSYTASWVGPMYTFRAPKIFQVSGGFGLKVGDGPNATSETLKSNASLLFSIGVYFPL